MAAEDNDIELWRRIDAAMEALPRPDRGRLARIEEELPERVSRTRWFPVVAAAIVTGTALAAGAAYWAGTADQPAEPEISAPRSGDAKAPAAQGRDETPAKEDGEESAGTGAQPSDAVIYQR